MTSIVEWQFNEYGWADAAVTIEAVRYELDAVSDVLNCALAEMSQAVRNAALGGDGPLEWIYWHEPHATIAKLVQEPNEWYLELWSTRSFPTPAKLTTPRRTILARGPINLRSLVNDVIGIVSRCRAEQGDGGPGKPMRHRVLPLSEIAELKEWRRANATHNRLG